jgi:hypothetical protein
MLCSYRAAFTLYQRCIESNVKVIGIRCCSSAVLVPDTFLTQPSLLLGKTFLEATIPIIRKHANVIRTRFLSFLVFNCAFFFESWTRILAVCDLDLWLRRTKCLMCIFLLVGEHSYFSVAELYCRSDCRESHE